MNNYFTGIGSRQTPANQLVYMTRLARYMCTKGWILRSGGATGADLAFESQVLPAECEIYIPTENFGANYSHYIRPSVLKSEYFIEPFEDYWGMAAQVAAKVHPNWKACSSFAKAAHTRDVFQVLGRHLDTPSKFVVCWAPHVRWLNELELGVEDNCDIITSKYEVVKGGTNTAVQVANKHNIPVFNLYHQDTRSKLKICLETLGVI